MWSQYTCSLNGTDTVLPETMRNLAEVFHTAPLSVWVC